MDPPSNSEQPFTGSYHSDILLLSAWLDGSQPTSESEAIPGPKENDTLQFLSHVSTVLTIGNDADRRAQKVLAVTGHVDASAVHCLVFTENTAPSTNPQKEAIDSRHSAQRAAQRHRSAQTSLEQLSAQAEQDPIKQRAQRKAHKARVKMLSAKAEAAAQAAQASSKMQAVNRALSTAQSASLSDSGEDQQQYCRTDLSVDDKRGKNLLLHWDQEHNDFAFDQHLQDTFDVLSYVRRLSTADPKRNDMIRNWQKFVHRRAYRKLALRVKMFAVHWGRPPFDIIGENLSTLRADPNLATTVELALPEVFRSLIKSVQVVMTLPLRAGEKVPRRRYVLDSASLKTWLKLLRYLWSRLCKILFVSNYGAPQIRSTTPDGSETAQLVQYIQGLRKLRPVIYHLFSLDCLRSPLERAEINEMNRWNLERQNSLFDPFNYPQPFAYALSPGSQAGIAADAVDPALADTQESTAVDDVAVLANDADNDDEPDAQAQGDDQVEDHDLDAIHDDSDRGTISPAAQTQEQNELEQDLDADEFTPEKNESQHARVMRSIDTIWAWNQAATYLFNEGRLNFSAGKSFDIARIEYPPFPAFSYNLEYLYQNCLPHLFPSVIWTREAVQDLIRRTWSAKIHAEAALMELAICSSDHQRESPIGVTKKCCRLCWLYKEKLNEQHPELSFVLPGTHGTFFAWIPPPRTPEVILKSLQAELLRVVRVAITKMELAHSRQSSAVGYESGREEVFEESDDLEDFEQFSDPFVSSDSAEQ